MPVLQPDAAQGPGVPAGRRARSHRPRRRRRYGRILPDASAGDPAARDDQRARVAAAALSRRGAGASRGDRRRDEETGVTIMRVVKELDAGPMLAVTTVPIAPDETSGEVERPSRARARRCWSRWSTTCRRVASSATPQDAAGARTPPR